MHFKGKRMGKIKFASMVLLLISVAIFGGYKLYEFQTRDTEPPKITAETDTITASVAITEEELLAGVTAMDNKSGDVTDSLVVETLSTFVNTNTREVIYAAIDEKGNVGRLTRTLVYTDYEQPKFTMTDDLRIPRGWMLDFSDIVGAESGLDGNMSDYVKYTLGDYVDTTVTGTYAIEFRVTDSFGNTAYLPVEVEIYDMSSERIDVKLTEYILYLAKGAEFHAEDYYVGSDIEGEFSIQHQVDTSQAGIYYVDYVVEGNNSRGKSRLIVVVRETNE